MHVITVAKLEHALLRSSNGIYGNTHLFEYVRLSHRDDAGQKREASTLTRSSSVLDLVFMELP